KKRVDTWNLFSSLSKIIFDLKSKSESNANTSERLQRGIFWFISSARVYYCERFRDFFGRIFVVIRNDEVEFTFGIFSGINSRDSAVNSNKNFHILFNRCIDRGVMDTVTFDKATWLKNFYLNIQHFKEM